MMRNDYRRALILLRSGMPGYSGHVRLERRTLAGSMYFLLQAPSECETLRIALVGQKRGDSYACALGEAQRNARGQAVLSYSFDPRNLCGRALEDYQLIAISCADAAECEIVLYGNVAGHAQLNWERAHEALCAIYGQAETVQSLEDTEGAQEPDTEGIHNEMNVEAQLDSDHEQDTPRTAGEILELDMNAPWPQSVESLRPLFQFSVPMENPPDEEYVYIAVSMPPESGYASCAVGVLAENGAPVSVRYALPAQWTAEPPAGMEEYSWVGDFNRGWWMNQQNLTNDF